DRGQVADARAQHVGGEARAGADLEHGITERDVGEHPRHEALADGAAPGVGPAVPAMESVHGGTIRLAGVAGLLYRADRCRETANRRWSNRCGWSDRWSATRRTSPTATGSGATGMRRRSSSTLK